MSEKLIFLSHIHEEKELALALQSAIEDEFSGFVKVFVSSDGTTIPAGANFLKRIENGLLDCVAALYLISPTSVKRQWVNFELGAVWVRNAASQRAGGPEIPAMPVCHSGMSFANMPAPLNNLNGIVARDASALEFAFRSLQAAVGGKGKLRTDFDELATRVRDFERRYTVGESLYKALSLVSSSDDRYKVAQHAEFSTGPLVEIDCGFVETGVIDQLNAAAAGELKGVLTVNVASPGMRFGPTGARQGADVQLKVDRAEVLKIKAQVAAS